jgi:ABC-type protease/lipase transport system fused ATPase/permease subunit
MAPATETPSPLLGRRRPVLAALGGCAVLSCAVNLLYLTSPLYMMQVLDRVLSSGNLDTLLYLTLIALLATVALAGIDVARCQAAAGLGTWLERAIGARALAAADPAAGLSDARAVAGLVRGPGAMALLDLPWSVLFLGVMWLLHPLLALLTLAGLAGLVALTVVGELVERRGQQAEHAARQAVTAITRSLEHEVALTRAMGIGEHLRARWPRSTPRSPPSAAPGPGTAS